MARTPDVVRVAVVQATPLVLDGPGSVERACALIREAGSRGARVVALPEGFVPLMPRPCWGHRYGETMSEAAAELHRRLWDNAVDVRGPLAQRLAAAARAAGAWVAVGVNERDDRRPGSLWNTLLWLSPDGRVAGRHRKLVPTMHERSFWGQGPGDDLEVHESPAGRLGGLICWEAFMPAARRRLHLAGVDVLVTPTADDRDLWLAAMRGFAFEAGAYVLSPVQWLRRADFPADFPLREALEECPEVLLSGGSAIVDPFGEVVAGPVRGREEILYAECDRRTVLRARRMLDTAGHYDRPELWPPDGPEAAARPEAVG